MSNKRRAFTLIELLVVNVLIGIIAMVIVIAYSGITARANSAVATNDLASARKQLLLFTQTNNEKFPASINSCPNPTAGNACIKSSQAITNYIVSADQKGFCAESGGYFITSSATNKPTAGSCSASAAPSPNITQEYTTPGNYNFTVPAGVYYLHTQTWSAQGGSSGTCAQQPTSFAGGLGNTTWSTTNVTPGQVIQITVGAKGSNGGNDVTGSCWYGSQGGGSQGGNSQIVHAGQVIDISYGGYGGNAPGYDPGGCYDDGWGGTVCYPESYFYGSTGGQYSCSYQYGTNYNNLFSSGCTSGAQSGNGRVKLIYNANETIVDYNTPGSYSLDIVAGQSVGLWSWGGMGGKGADFNGYLGGQGGYGGYAYGVKNIATDTTLTINVGARGAANITGGQGTAGDSGQESNIKIGSQFLTRAYGGMGGYSVPWWDGCYYYDDWEQQCVGSDWNAYADAPGGDGGGGWVDSSLTSQATGYYYNAADGHVRILYIKPVSTPVTF